MTPALAAVSSESVALMLRRRLSRPGAELADALMLAWIWNPVLNGFAGDLLGAAGADDPASGMPPHQDHTVALLLSAVDGPCAHVICAVDRRETRSELASIASAAAAAAPGTAPGGNSAGLAGPEVWVLRADIVVDIGPELEPVCFLGDPVQAFAARGQSAQLSSSPDRPDTDVRAIHGLEQFVAEMVRRTRAEGADRDFGSISRVQGFHHVPAGALGETMRSLPAYLIDVARFHELETLARFAATSRGTMTLFPRLSWNIVGDDDSQGNPPPGGDAGGRGGSSAGWGRKVIVTQIAAAAAAATAAPAGAPVGASAGAHTAAVAAAAPSSAPLTFTFELAAPTEWGSQLAASNPAGAASAAAPEARRRWLQIAAGGGSGSGGGGGGEDSAVLALVSRYFDRVAGTSMMCIDRLKGFLAFIQHTAGVLRSVTSALIDPVPPRAGAAAAPAGDDSRVIVDMQLSRRSFGINEGSPPTAAAFAIMSLSARAVPRAADRHLRPFESLAPVAIINAVYLIDPPPDAAEKLKVSMSYAGVEVANIWEALGSLNSTVITRLSSIGDFIRALRSLTGKELEAAVARKN
jgi:hypothetical protein